MPAQERYCFLDNLRAAVIVLVVVLHASLCYMVYAPAWWYVVDPVRSLVFDLVVILTDVPIMPALFFLAGFFAFPSLERRGPGDFMRDKSVRIGLPWLFGALFLAPPIAYMIYLSRDVPVSLAQFWSRDFWGPLYQHAVYWYLGVLFFFYALLSVSYDGSERLRGWQRSQRVPTGRLLLGFLGVVTVAFFLLSLLWTHDDWRHVYVLVYQPVRIPLYVGYFVLGIVADRNAWFTDAGYRPRIEAWLPLLVVSGAFYAMHILIQIFGPPGTLPHRLVTAVLFNVFCLAGLMAGLSVFQRFVDRRGPAWRSLARNSYGIYYLHPLILYPLAYLAVPLALPAQLKAMALIVVTVLACWSLSEVVLTRAPGLRRMFGPGPSARSRG